MFSYNYNAHKYAGFLPLAMQGSASTGSESNTPIDTEYEIGLLPYAGITRSQNAGALIFCLAHLYM